MNLFPRVFSAFVALCLLGSITFYGNATGLALATSIIILGAFNEFRKTAFEKVPTPKTFQALFIIAGIFIFASILYGKGFSSIGFAIGFSFFYTFGLWVTRNKVTNENLLRIYGLGSLGLLYCALFPAFAVRILLGPHGIIWFYALLIIVFIGDTFAYFSGWLWGNKKLYPQLSPKKTFAGAIGGAFGSITFGSLYLKYFFPELFLGSLIIFCFLCAVAAQSGDLFISLIKRVANVKDTGRLMPGHGGLLDRLDGILMTAPLVYAFSVFF